MGISNRFGSSRNDHNHIGFLKIGIDRQEEAALFLRKGIGKTIPQIDRIFEPGPSRRFGLLD